MAGHREVLLLRTSGTTKTVQAATLVKAACLGQGVGDCLFDALLDVARQKPPARHPQQPTPPPPPHRETASRWPLLTGGGTLSENPSRSG